MSYTEERDEIAELFGYSSKPKKGYSKEVTPEEAESGNTEPPPVTSPPPPAAVPVAMTPPAVAAPAPAPAQHPETPAAPEIEDDEILVYDESDPPDFSTEEFYAFEKETVQAPPAEPIPEPATGDSPAIFSQAGSLEPAETEVRLRPPAESFVEPAPVKSPEEIAQEKQASKLAAAARIVEETPVEKIAAAASMKAVERVEPARTSEPAAEPKSAPLDSGRSFVREEPKSVENQKPLLLDTRGLVKIYDGRTVVNGVDINVRPGEIVGLLGPNGAGKTTSFYMMVGLVPPNDGKVFFDGKDVTKQPMYQRARLGMGYLPQEESIFRKLTVEENIMAVMETLNISKKERKARCQELLERFSITHIRKNIALTCSGGEKRRVTIARSLVTKPKLLMLDEPFSGVDPIAVNEIQNIVQGLKDSGLAILITDHNARQTLELVDRAYLIYEGKVLREGSRDFLINDPVSRELYLGDRFTM